MWVYGSRTEDAPDRPAPTTGDGREGMLKMLKRILTPTDGSETAKAAIRFATDIAIAEDAEVEVLGVVHALQFGDATTYDPTPEIEAEMRTAVDAEVTQLKAAGVRASGKTIPGDQIFKTITDTAAKDGADLIVMGTHGRSGLSRMIIGSVADRVVRHSSVPVVLVPMR